MKRALLGLWAVWWSIVLAGNVADAARAVGTLPESWPFASGNYRAIVDTTARYGTPAWVNAGLFGGVICWEASATLLFWRAWWRYGDAATRRRAVRQAFLAGLSLWLRS